LPAVIFIRRLCGGLAGLSALRLADLTQNSLLFSLIKAMESLWNPGS
jgi:hypothetical protein